MIIVQKYGGTSLATQQQQKGIAEKIKKQLLEKKDLKIIVVVSAMGRKGDPYATDTLLSMIKYKETSGYKHDLLLSCGETISAALLGINLEHLNIKNKVLTGWNMGIQTDDNHGNAKIKNVDANIINRQLEENSVIVVTGFQGISPNKDLTTIGRGGSDVTAVALGIALAADKVEIYTDVGGIMTADPKVVPDAKVIEEITYQEVFHMAIDGAKVIHPRAVEMAMQNDVNLWIKSMRTANKGTLVTHHEKGKKKWENGKLITGITAIDDLTYFRIYTEKIDRSVDLELFQNLATRDISLDLISITPKIKGFVVCAEHKEEVAGVIKFLKLKFDYIYPCTKVSLIGMAMKGRPGVMAKVLYPLTNSKIPIIQTSDSHINISVLVESKFSEKCTNLLHNYLITN